MKNLGRWLFSVTLCISLFLAAVTPMVWVQSYHGGISIGQWQPHLFVIRFSDATTYPPSKRMAAVPRIKALGNLWMAYSWRGGFSISWLEANYMQHSIGSIYERADPIFLGFGLNRAPAGTTPPGSQSTYARQGTLRIPCWFFQFLSMIIPGYWVIARHRRASLAHRLKHHLCSNCGYDLRATPDRCPECGWKPARIDYFAFMKSLVRACVNRYRPHFPKPASP